LADSLLRLDNLVIRIDRAKAARYGISVSDVNAVVQAAMAGKKSQGCMKAG
jgi:heavy metal efflux system protein